jgi:DNA-binding response OmpR family regulator/anti-sigma regulatory factor (Ser/Thr protein kinase)
MECDLNILVVDDDEMMAQSIQSVLNTKGHQVQMVHNPLKALKIIEEGCFDLVLLDVMMPEMTGFQLIDALNRTNLDTYFIIMTGETSMESAVEAIRRGASDYLKKPFEPDELFIRVDNILKQKKQKKERQQIEAQKKALEIELQQSQKLEAVGTLAGGVAHDFNNILSIILGYSELALDSVAEWDPIRQNLEQIFIAGNRAKDITYQLLSFCRKSDTEQHPFNLNTIILESLKLMRASLPANIEIRQNLLDETLTVLGDTTQIQQIMINLCTNAAHAMQDTGGTIDVRLENVTLEASHAAQYNDLAPGNYIKLVVADTGTGIDPEIADKIFDPYFTTKDIGKGTGMGLSLVRGIVKNHGGDIRVHSEVGRFTNIVILLPIFDESELDADCTHPDCTPLGKERILLVDDEEMLLDIMTQVMNQWGYKTTAFSDSQEALEAFRNHPDDFDLVVSDMAMPKRTGLQIGLEMKKIREDIPIIICSGFSEKISHEKARENGFQAFIMKPVIMSELADIIRSVLDDQQSDRRKDKRFKAMSGAFIISKANKKEKGKVLDISKSGLSFKYDFESKFPGYMDKATINMADKNFTLDNLTYKTVSDTMQPDSKEGDGEIRRRGVQFEKLSPIQSEKLAFFIKNYTEGSVN